MVNDNRITAFEAWMVYYTIYVGSCTLSCLAFITLFRNWIHSIRGWWSSLSDNAYLIYLIHFVFVIWAQYLLLPYGIPVPLKLLIMLISALFFSWVVRSLMRKNKWIRKYL